MARKKLLHLKSNVVNSNGTPKLPTSEQIEFGEIAVNYANGHETLAIKNSSGGVVSFSNDQILMDYVDSKTTPKQTTGDSTTDVMSQKAITTYLGQKLAISDFNTYSGAVDTLIDGKASQSDLSALNNVVTAHTANTTIHVTANDKTKWNSVDNKLNTSDFNTYSGNVNTTINGKVDKVSGKGLSTNDYTTAEKNKLGGIASGAEVNQNAFSNIKVGSTTIAADSKTDTLEISGGGIVTVTADATNDKITISASNAVTSVAGKTGAVTLVKSDVGLGNVDNTADASKTVKAATSAATADTAKAVALSGVTNAEDLKAIEALTGTSGLLKKTAANTWALDTNSYSTTAVAVTGATYNSTNKKIELKNAAGTVVSTVDATAFIKDGMVSNVEVKNVASSGTCLVITFNTDAGKDAINIPISQIFDANNYYTKADLTSSSTTVVVAKASSATTAASAGSVALSNVTGADDIKAIEALTGTSGLLKKTAANTWALDTTSYSSATQVNTALSNKVDKVSGKGLSTNDYTTDEKNKLAGIAAGAEVNVQSDWNATSGDAAILNKPTSFTPSAHNQASNTITTMAGYSKPTSTTAIATGDTLNAAIGKLEKALDGKSNAGHTHDGTYAKNAFGRVTVGSTNIDADTTGDTLTLSGSNVTLTPDATNDKLTIGITKSNVTTALGYTPPTTDTNYYATGLTVATAATTNTLTISGTNSAVKGSGVISAATTTAAGLMSADDKTKLNGIAAGAEVNVQSDWNATSGDALILNKPTIPAAVAVKGNAETNYRTGNVNITPANIGLGNVGNFKAVSTVASQGLTDTEKTNARANIGAGTSSFSGSYNDLSNKPTIPAAANNGTYTVKTLVGSTTTNVSDFTANQSTADDVTFVQGSNVTITPDATNRKITIAATDTKYTAATAAPGKVASASAQGSSANYARQDHTHGIDLATGDSNGQVKIAGTNVSVKGLGTAAYKAEGYFAGSGHTHTNMVTGSSLTANDIMVGNGSSAIKASGKSFETTLSTTSDTKIPTSKAIATYVTSQMTSVLTYKGTVNQNSDLPASHKVGDVWVVASANTYAGKACEVGDYIICKAAGTAASDADWDVINGENQVDNKSASLAAAGNSATLATVDGTNITVTTPSTWTGVAKTGTVTKVSTGAGLKGGDITSTGTVKCALSSETKSTLAATAMGSTASRQYAVGLDANGVLSVNVPWTDHTYTVNNGTFTVSGNGASVASTSANANANTGVNIKAGNNVTITTGTSEITIAASQPTVNNGTLAISGNSTSVATFTANQSGNSSLIITAGTNVTITPDATNHKITIAAKDTTYSTATTAATGLMSAEDKAKLNGIAAGAEVNVQSDWNATSGDAAILNKPTSFTPSAHNQASNTITSMAGYSKPTSTTAIATGDTLNAAIGKLEKALDGKQASGNYLTGITSAQVTTALGYTPYNSTNPNGYTSNNGTVTSITAGTGLQGGTITSSGTISLGMPTVHSATTYTSSNTFTSSEPIVYCLCKFNGNLSSQVCPVSSLAEGQQCNVIYNNTGSTDYTVSFGTTYLGPEGGTSNTAHSETKLTVKKYGYGEVNFIKLGGTIFLRGV